MALDDDANEFEVSSSEEYEEAIEDQMTLSQFSPRSRIPSSMVPLSNQKRPRTTGEKLFRLKIRNSNQISKLVVSDHVGKSRIHNRKRATIDRVYDSSETKLCALERAEQVQSNLEPQFPSFLKLMLRSHVSNGFWLGLPKQFCESHLPKRDSEFTLVDECGEEYQTKFLAEKTGLSGGWRGFSIVHCLVEGDVLVFHLIKATTFKVYIVRENDFAEVDGALGLLNLDACSKQIDAENGIKTSGETEGKHSKSRSSADLQENIKSSLRRSVANLEPPVGELSDKASEEVESEVSKHLRLSSENGIKTSGETKGKHSKSRLSADLQENIKGSLRRSVTNLEPPVGELSEKDSEEIESKVSKPLRLSSGTIVKFKDFTIMVNGLIIASELSKQTCTKYYELCCSQNAFLHDHLLAGVNHKLLAGIISKTVNIAGALRGCKLTTSRDEFEIWDRTLNAFELLGMNVGFLRARLQRLVCLAFEAEEALASKRYSEACLERILAEDEIRTLENKLKELKESFKRLDAQIEKLKVKAERHELKFQHEANAPWQ